MTLEELAREIDLRIQEHGGGVEVFPWPRPLETIEQWQSDRFRVEVLNNAPVYSTEGVVTKKVTLLGILS